MGAPRTDPPRGPGLRFEAVYPADGDGTECAFDAPPDCGVPRDSAIELRFDRYLLPRSVTRGAVTAYSGIPENGVFFDIEYDVVERVARFRPYGGFWAEGLLYTAIVHAPDPEDEASAGFRAFDGAPLTEELEFEFRTARVAPNSVQSADKRTTCNDFLDTVARAGCVGCHAGPTAPQGLRLDSEQAVQRTAVRRVARETELGPSVGEPLSDALRFGRQMPIIEPGAPANSYLLYKLITKEDNFGPPAEACRTAHAVPLGVGACLPASPEERQRLMDWFVAPEPMPPTGSLGVDDLRSIQQFVADGALCK